MRTRFLIVWGSLALLCAMSLLARPARAQNYNFDLANFKALADDPSPDTIPIGTKITLQNWQQYKKFMPVWLQAEYSGQYHWHITNDPIYTIEVGPTHNFPFPQKYQEDTEKYAGQTRLVKAPSGGYTIEGYVAGQPFPNPTEPLKATKLMYNAWLIFRPSILNYTTKDWLVDQYDNVSTEDTDDTWYQMSHISEPNSPVALPFANGNLFAARYLVTAPEQSKYTTELQLQPADPSKYQESYVFLPSLRRSLRLSSAARCSPILGTDYVQDDGAWMPANFDAHYIGSKKLLTIVMNSDGAYTPSNFQGASGSKNNSLPGWPKAGTNKWEIRTYDVIDLQGLPALGAYCYSHRIFYVDKQTAIAAMAGVESYDRTGKLYKVLWEANAPYNFRGQTTILNYTTTMSLVWDFQNKHATANNDEPATFDEAAPAALQDVATLSTPGGLASVMK
jgi:hypothetical protein